MNIEEPAIEKEKVSIMLTLANCAKELNNIENKILRSLTESQGLILDDAKLIENLRSSKSISE